MGYSLHASRCLLQSKDELAASRLPRAVLREQMVKATSKTFKFNFSSFVVLSGIPVTAVRAKLEKQKENAAKLLNLTDRPEQVGRHWMLTER